MKIVFTGLENERYRPELGKTNEHNNFYLLLKSNPKNEVTYIPFDRALEIGKRAYNQELLDAVKREKPDLFWAFMYTDELEPETLDEIKKLTTSVAWFSDDHWRLDNYSRFWAPHFTQAITTWSKAKKRYAKYGIHNVIRSQWGFNPGLYKSVVVPRQDIKVSFIGMQTSHRKKIIDELREAGVDVFVRGYKWSEGRASFTEMLDIFSRSKINLNLNPPMSAISLKSIAQIFFRRRRNLIVPDFWHIHRNLRSYFQKKIPQIKARPFEITGSGGFCITGGADDTENYFEPDKEIVVYKDTEDLIKKVRYYLEHDEERKTIAKAGYERALREHAYGERLEKIFEELGLK
ncbi:glycosyltransferase [Patescibacteria group bacterium]|nr:glycosyltransferase [Patescibacteria group bacterium]